MDLYLFDFDHTLYSYDSSKRLPALARATDRSQYHLARAWWVGGYERRAEAGEWADAEDYLDEFARVTESRRLSLEEWAATRRAASTPNRAVVDALASVLAVGTASLLSNNPSPFEAGLPLFAPEAAELLGDHVLVSASLGVRKPDARIFELALERFGAAPENTLFIDDSVENVRGAIAVGIHGHRYDPHSPDRDDALRAAITAFQERAR